ISIKILTEDDPANSLKTAEQLGLIEAGLKEIPFTTGEEISQFATEELQAVVLEKSIFAQLNSEQMIKVLDALQAQDEHVAVLGTSIADLKVMHQANFRITRKDSRPTVLDHADIIVLKNTANALPNVLKKGQRIVNGLLDVLKLNLTRIACTLMLLVAMYAAGGRIFYYHPTQGGVISAFTVILPSIALSLWASAKPIKGKNMPRILIHFIIPAGAMISLCILLINFLFRNAGFGIIYTQQVVTHTLVLMGLILVVFVQPPVRLLEGGDDSSRNWQPSFVAALLFLVFQLATRLSIAQRFLMIAPLQSARHYLLIFGIVLLWSILLLGIWRLIWPERFRSHISKPNDEILVEAKKSRG
ncbi:MAG: hypothetical protein U9R53_07760, partial [Chloroflexota bacterium]|nr:hypothetical protein [Chloroflexota bacterium]